jgi:hypothetical protein
MESWRALERSDMQMLSIPSESLHEDSIRDIHPLYYFQCSQIHVIPTGYVLYPKHQPQFRHISHSMIIARDKVLPEACRQVGD